MYSEELTRREQFEDLNTPFYRPYDREYERLKGLDLSFEAESWFVQTCLDHDIIPMISVFTHLGVDRAKKAGFKSIKIASYDSTSLPLIKRSLDFASEVVISTGATKWSEVCGTVEFLKSYKRINQKIGLLHAKTIYPTPLNEMSLARMLALRIFGFEIGLSDHTNPTETGLSASKYAILLGANYIERHFTILERDRTKVGPVSIQPNELLDLNKFCQLTNEEKISNIKLKDFDSLYQCQTLEPSQTELNNKLYYRGRFASNLNGKVVNSWEENIFEK